MNTFSFENHNYSVCHPCLLKVIKTDARVSFTAKVGAVEFEMPLIVELEQSGGVGVLLLQVEVVHLGLLGGVTTVLTNIHLGRSG